MADLPPKQPDPAKAATAVPADSPPAPRLLVMPPTESIPSLVWPGADGEPAWAIPVEIPAGTRGYALFIPMVPAQPAAPTVTKPAAQPEKPAATPAVTTPAVTAPAAAAPAAVKSVAPAPLALPPTKAPPPAPQRPQTQSPQYPARPFGTYDRPPSAWQTFRKKHWPGPKKGLGWAVPAGVLAGALGFLIFLPLDRVGIGWFLGWLALTLGVAFTVRRSADLPRRERLLRSGWAVAALALLLIPAFRNAWWLVTFSVLGAIGCTALAIVGGRQVRSILFSLVAAPYAAFAGIPWVRRHLRAGRNPGIARRIFFSVTLTAVVLLVFGALLSSADVAFSQLLDGAIPDLSIGSIFQWIFLAAAGGLLAVSGIYTLTAPPATSTLDTEGKGRFGLIEWAPAGRQQAREALAELGPAAIGSQKDCRAADQFDLPKTRR